MDIHGATMTADGTGRKIGHFTTVASAADAVLEYLRYGGEYLQRVVQESAAILGGEAPEEVRNATILILAVVKQTAADAAMKGEITSLLKTHAGSGNRAPAAVLRELCRLIEQEEVSGDKQDLRSLAIALAWATDQQILPESGHEEAFVAQLDTLEPERLAGCEALAATKGPDATRVIGRLLYDEGGRPRPGWATALKIEPSAMLVKKRLQGRAPAPPKWWERWVKLGAIGTAAILVLGLTGWAIYAATPPPHRDESDTDQRAQQPSPDSTPAVEVAPLLSPVVMDIPSGKKVVVIPGTDLDGMALLELENTLHSLVLTSAAGKPDDKMPEKPGTVVIPYRNTPAAEVVPSIGFSGPGATGLTHLLAQYGQLSGAEYALVGRQVARDEKYIRFAADLVLLPSAPPAEPKPPPEPKTPPEAKPAAPPQVVWSGMWSIPVPAKAKTATAPLTESLRVQIVFGGVTASVLAAETLVAQDSATPADYALAAAAYLKLGPSPAASDSLAVNSRERARELLMRGIVLHAKDVRLARLLSATLDKSHRESLVLQKPAVLSGDKEHERFLTAKDDEQQEKILKEWVESILKEGGR